MELLGAGLNGGVTETIQRFAPEAEGTGVGAVRYKFMRLASADYS